MYHPLLTQWSNEMKYHLELAKKQECEGNILCATYNLSQASYYQNLLALYN